MLVNQKKLTYHVDFDSEVKIERFVSKILDKMGALHSHENQNHGHGK